LVQNNAVKQKPLTKRQEAALKRAALASNKPLPIRQEAFIEFYITNGGNGAKAYRDAGYKCTQFAAEACASRLLRNARVLSAITARRAKVREVAAVTAQEVIAALASFMRGQYVPWQQRLGAASQLCKVLGIEQKKMANENDPERLKAILDERVNFALEGFKRGGAKGLTRRDIIEFMAEAPLSAGDLYPLIQEELASVH
jgi:hypothetical protein